MKKLIGMTDFVIEAEKIVTLKCWAFGTFYLNTIDHAKFLQQTPTLGMFVPTDEDGNVLEGKPLSPATDKEWDVWEKEKDAFKEAEQRVIFDGWEFESELENTVFIGRHIDSMVFTKGGKININGKNIETIEDLVPYNLILK